MPSERVQRQIDALLNEAEEAMKKEDWTTVRQRCNAALRLDETNEDAPAYLKAADKDTAAATPPVASTAGHVVSLAPPPATPSHPASFASGRYAVKRFLGEGGKKRVFLAHDTVLDRDVAFALIKTEGLDETAKTRITREAQAMGRLGDHPHLMPIHDLGQEGGQPYMTLPLMGGGDVEGLIKKAPNHQLVIEKVLEIGIATAKGLAFAHGKGIVHRDIKPGNVWMTAEGVAKIGDFGLAVASDTATRLTTAGMMVGTVSYMPPEQAMGGEVTAKADLYSLGAMLYEMVTGRPPFVGDDAVAIIGQHLNTPPVAPTWHRPDCPPALEGLILRLLEKDPAKRPASAGDVVRAIESLSDSGVGAKHPLNAPATKPGTADASPVPSPSPLYRRAFVGREAEVKQLQAAFDAAMAGQGGLAMVVGEPGIGKTALIEQASTYVALRGGKALVGHCYEEGSLSLPYLAFVEAMRSYVLEREPEGLKKDLGTAAGDVARIVSEVRDRVQVEVRPPGDPEDDRWRLMQAATAFLRNASLVQPLLVVLEDLHWADKGTLDMLLHSARNLQGARLLLVGTYRDVEVDRNHPLSATLGELRRGNAFSRIPLRGLTADEVRRMMNAITGQDVPYSLSEAVHRQTEGNPLFIQEVLRYLVEEGLLTRDGGGKWAASGNTLTERIPEGLRDVIGRRLSRLSAEGNRVLAIAGVIGRDFRLDTLRLVSGLEEESLLKVLEVALRVGILEERSRTGVVQYRFTHAYFRQTLYEELIAPRRLRLHQEVARALEAQYASRLDEHASELAEHFSNSTDMADLRKAVDYGERAARKAMGVYAYGEAVRHLEKCIQVQEVVDAGDKNKLCDMLLALGDVLSYAGETKRAAEEVAEGAYTLAAGLDDAARVSRACNIATEALGRLTEYGTPAYLEWATRAGRWARAGTAERVYADVALARRARAEGRLADDQRLELRAMSLARELKDDQALIAVGRNIIQGPLGYPHLREELAKVLREMLALRPKAGTRHQTVILWNAGVFALNEGDRKGGEQHFADLVRLGERSRDPTAEIYSLQAQSLIALLEGRLEEAAALRVTIVSTGEQNGTGPFARGVAAGLPSRALVYLGRYDEAVGAAATINRAMTITPPWLLALAGRAAEAKAALDTLVRRLGREAIEAGEIPTATLTTPLEAAVLVGDRTTATLLSGALASSRGQVAAIGAFGAALNPARLLGQAHALMGHPKEALEDLTLAFEYSQRIRNRPEIALTHLFLGELLLDSFPRDRLEAAKHLDAAIGEFRDMKMQPSLERALKRKEILKA